MSDQVQLEVSVAAKLDQVIAGLGGLEAQLGSLAAKHDTAAAHAKSHGETLDMFAKQTEGVAQHLEFMALGFEHLRGILFGGAITFGLEQMITQTAQFNIQADTLSRVLGGNAEAATSWIAIADHMNIGAEQITKAFDSLSKGIQGGSKTLSEIGVASETLDGKLRPLTSVIADVADWFHKNAGASNEAGVAMGLFGRAGAQLIPILEQGSGGIASLQAEMQRLGLTMDDVQLRQATAFTHALDEGKLAAQGLVYQLGNALIPGLAALAQSIASNTGLIDQFAAAVNRAVSFAIGFIEGMTGQTLAVSESAVALGTVTDAVGGYGNAADTAGGSGRGLADASKAVRDAMKDQTSAIDDQVRALQDLQRLQDAASTKTIKDLTEQKKERDLSAEDWIRNLQDTTKQLDQAASDQEASLRNETDAFNTQMDAQIQSIQDRSKAFEDSINDQIKALENANRTEQEQDKLGTLQQDRSREVTRIAQNEANVKRSLAQGNFQDTYQLMQEEAAARLNLGGIDRQITQENRTIAIQGLQSQLDQAKETATSQISDLQRQKKAQDDVYADQIKQVQDAAATRKRAADELIAQIQENKREFDNQRDAELADLQDVMAQRRADDAEQVRILQDQKRRIQEAGQAQLEAMQQAGAGTNQALKAGFAGVADAASKSGTDAGIRFAKDFKTEMDGQQFGKAFSDDFSKAMKGDPAGFKQAADTLGQAFAQGFTDAVGRSVGDIKIGPFKLGDLASVIGDLKDLGTGSNVWGALSDLANKANSGPSAPRSLYPTLPQPSDYQPSTAPPSTPVDTSGGGTGDGPTFSEGGMKALVAHAARQTALLERIAYDGMPAGMAASMALA